MRSWTLDRVMHFILFAGAIAFSLWILNYLEAVLFPFFAAFLLAYILDPLVTKLQKKVKHRIVAVLLVLLGLLVVVGGSMYAFVPQVVHEVRYLGTLLSKIFTDASWADRILPYIPADKWQSLKSMISWDNMAETLQDLDLWSTLQTLADKVVPSAWGFLTKTSAVFVWISSAAVILMYLVFIMLDMPKLRSGVKSLVPMRYREEASSFAVEMDRFMGSYFRAQSMVALIVGVLYSIGFGVMGLPMGVAFGLFSGALNMVPYMQLTTIPLALLLSIVYALDTSLPFWEVALMVLAIYLVVQVIQDFFLVPRIVGKSMNLPPVGILLSLSIWGKLLGFLGLLVAIPFTCLCLVYVDKLKSKSRAYADKKTRPGPEALFSGHLEDLE